MHDNVRMLFSDVCQKLIDIIKERDDTEMMHLSFFYSQISVSSGKYTG